MSSRDPSKEAANFAPKQEGFSASEDASKTVSKASFAPTPWFRLKDPRVVRVSRAFGGKDRHSKVCTIRGLRDRRVRLSVPTAIQLYDLQDRLGLSQPSKVVDWLLDAAKHEIDELPPLPMQPVHLGQPPMFHQNSSSSPSTSLAVDQNLSSNRELGSINGMNWDGSNNSSKSSQRKFLNNSDANSCRNKSNGDCDDEGNRGIISRNDQEEIQQESEGQAAEELVQHSDFSSKTNHNSNYFPYSSNIYHLEPPSIANLPHHGLVTSQSSLENPQSLMNVQISSALSLSQTHPYFPVQFIASSGAGMDPRQVSQFQPTLMMSSGLQNFLPISHEPPLNSLSHHQSSARAPFNYQLRRKCNSSSVSD
ncbi:hypothetical protein CDL15_Pgr020489 [Punica granatum]|nr:hypothetical protein CDL15_Pgr020489 [Punica granatum]PKI32960.1 hypothetical protein CRG98_046634 [Punica granatum]